VSLAEDLARSLATGSDVVTFIDERLRRTELGQPFRLLEHQRIILRAAFAFGADGRVRYDTIIYSCPKKSGKTTINAAVTLWWALTQEPPNEVLAIQGLLTCNPDLDPGADVTSRAIRLSNGTVITAIASEYAGAAGSNHGLTSWDELWGYTAERSQRLYEELTPVPTRTNSIRFITTYAGWEHESILLWDLYRQGVAPDEYAEGRGVRLHPELPLFANPEARLFVYWDHERRMPWQSLVYYDGQRRSLRPGTYLRLHENRWATAETAFITPELWDPCVDPTWSPLPPTRTLPLFVGVDAGIKHDTAAVVAVCWYKERLSLAAHRIWRPSPTEPLDLEATVEAYLRYLHRHYRVAAVWCDPYQLHRSITTLQAVRMPIEAFPQTSSHTTQMGQTLFDLLNGRNLRLYPAADLRQQALQTVSLETPRGWRIAKEKAGHKIDAIVALAIACVAAIEGKPKALDLAKVEAFVQLNAALTRTAPWLADDDEEGL
jgi:phage terminase large subunit-like protein